MFLLCKSKPCILIAIICFHLHFLYSVHGSLIHDDDMATCSVEKGCTALHHNDQNKNINGTVVANQELSDRNLYHFDEKCECLPFEYPQEGGRIAYLITAHDDLSLRDALLLLKKIVAPGFIVLIHLDTKIPKEMYLESALHDYVNKKDQCNHCGAKIFVNRMYNVEWGRWR